MNQITAYLIIIGAIIIVALITWFLLWIINRAKKKKNLIPSEAVALFEEAERRLRYSKGEADPYKILFDLATEKEGRMPQEEAQSKFLELDQPIQPYTEQTEFDNPPSQKNEVEKIQPFQKKTNFFSKFRKRQGGVI